MACDSAGTTKLSSSAIGKPAPRTAQSRHSDQWPISGSGRCSDAASAAAYRAEAEHPDVVVAHDWHAGLTLAMLRTSELNGCPYCAAVHGAKFESIGGATEQAAALKQRQLPQGLFSEEELTVLQLTDEMTLMVRGQPETVGKAIALFGVDGAVELMAVIALLNFDNRMALSLIHI